MYTVSQKRDLCVSAITLANINRFSNFFTVEFGNKFATIFYYIAHHTLNVLLHYLANSKLLFFYFPSTINANAVIFGHENEAV